MHYFSMIRTRRWANPKMYFDHLVIASGFVAFSNSRRVPKNITSWIEMYLREYQNKPWGYCTRLKRWREGQNAAVRLVLGYLESNLGNIVQTRSTMGMSIEVLFCMCRRRPCDGKTTSIQKTYYLILLESETTFWQNQKCRSQWGIFASSKWKSVQVGNGQHTKESRSHWSYLATDHRRKCHPRHHHVTAKHTSTVNKLELEEVNGLHHRLHSFFNAPICKHY